MLLFCLKIGLSIEYDENNNTFQFHQLPVCDDIASLYAYTYVYINGIILFFGGWNGNILEIVVSRSVHKYSIRENKWLTFENTLSSPLYNCVAVLSEESMYVHIAGGVDGEYNSMSAHMKKKVSEWLSKEEMKKEIELKVEEEEKNEDETSKILKKQSVKKKVEEGKWMKWWNQREQKDKTEIIEKFKTMSNEQFQLWLLNECKWKHEITKDDINSIRFSIDAYLELVTTNQDSKEDELTAYVIIDERKKLIKMKNLTFEELLRQSHNCLEWKDMQRMRNKNLKLELIGTNNNIIESNEGVIEEFKNKEPTFKINWTSFQQLIKTIKNALVIMIAISEYIDNKMWSNLPNVKETDIKNFKQLFKQELNYEIVCNQSPKMTKDDIQNFMDRIVLNFKLCKNTNKYDGLIMIICGYGENGNTLIASDGKCVSIDKIRSSFNCHKMESFKDFPKIFITDMCCDKNIPKANEIVKKGNEISHGHNDDGFLIWSTTKGHRVADLSLLSGCIKKIVNSKYKSGYPFNQMLQDISTEIRNNKSSEGYCIESQDTTDYDIIFQQRISVNYCIFFARNM
ncbi:hypothetical protein RFI_38598 [Reticulomyxa filosa]|uniref:Caspase family p20 domain-containing protein n=1 Tax=Reticulomyxa filosa TaxID=46433 RepID=X6LDV7_RETFI|nr:hypothetical protein RFI_38598 [Reticulomyxa filosa]|eukprot:ETN98889.1 hypothetical protein RFI_38598 [Reticulomyxa filosa]